MNIPFRFAVGDRVQRLSTYNDGVMLHGKVIERLEVRLNTPPTSSEYDTSDGVIPAYRIAWEAPVEGRNRPLSRARVQAESELQPEQPHEIRVQAAAGQTVVIEVLK